jgi:hypothetical protein
VVAEIVTFILAITFLAHSQADREGPRARVVAMPIGRLRAWTMCLMAVIAVVAPAGRAASPPSDAVYRKLCRAIQAKHVRALFTAPVAPIQLGGQSDCAFVPRGSNVFVDSVRVFLRIDDGDQTLWKHIGDRSYGRFRVVTGVGRHAKWGYQGGRLPSVADARTGTFTCTVIPTIGGTMFATSPGAALSAAGVYAKRLLALCGDVFAAYR